jgi:ABC-type nitrate/sulfonate/bicarbonate transport system substrate-binding protein
MSSGDPVQIRVGGVPEHFNLPWHLAIEAGEDVRSGLSILWRDYATGTGSMLAALAGGELDLAILLTEGAALGLARKMPIGAISLYTTSPLIWGVHVPPGSSSRSIVDLCGARFAISRYGSGSHLMSLAMAMDHGWPVDRLSFVVVDDLPGAVAAFGAGTADVFLWEHFTTQPEVDAGRFRRIGDFVAPWPAWTVCAAESVLRERRAAIEALLVAVAGRARQLADAADGAARIASRYGLRESAVTEWLGTTTWAAGPTDPHDALAAARRMLDAAKAV